MIRGLYNALIGVGIIVFGMFLFNGQNSFILSSKHATGTVVQNQLGGSKNSTYHAVVQFTAPDGTAVKFTSNVGTITPEFGVGKQVDVLYNPKNPQDAQINSLLDLWMAPGLVFIIGLLFIIFGLGGAYFAYKKKAKDIVEKRIKAEKATEEAKEENTKKQDNPME